MMARRCVPFVLLMAVFVAQATRAGATPITPTNWDTISAAVTAGAVAGATITVDIIGGGGADLGDVQSTVYLTAGLYTYVHKVTPAATYNNVSEFATGFSVIGFDPFGPNGISEGAVAGGDDPQLAGWSFGEAGGVGGAGGAGTAADFTLNFEADSTLDWNTQTLEGGSLFWDGSEAITLFFQSTFGPGFGLYGILDGPGGSGNATSYAPVPEPATLLLFGTGLLGCGALVRRRYSPRMG